MWAGATSASQPQILNAGLLSLKCLRIVSCMQYVTTEDTDKLEIAKKHTDRGPDTEVHV